MDSQHTRRPAVIALAWAAIFFAPCMAAFTIMAVFTTSAFAAEGKPVTNRTSQLAEAADPATDQALGARPIVRCTHILSFIESQKKAITLPQQINKKQQQVHDLVQAEEATRQALRRGQHLWVQKTVGSILEHVLPGFEPLTALVADNEFLWNRGLKWGLSSSLMMPLIMMSFFDMQSFGGVDFVNSVGLVPTAMGLSFVGLGVLVGTPEKVGENILRFKLQAKGKDAENRGAEVRCRLYVTRHWHYEMDENNFLRMDLPFEVRGCKAASYSPRLGRLSRGFGLDRQVVEYTPQAHHPVGFAKLVKGSLNGRGVMRLRQVGDNRVQLSHTLHSAHNPDGLEVFVAEIDDPLEATEELAEGAR